MQVASLISKSIRHESRESLDQKGTEKSRLRAFSASESALEVSGSKRAQWVCRSRGIERKLWRGLLENQRPSLRCEYVFLGRFFRLVSVNYGSNSHP